MNDKVVFITGDAGGIGLEIATQFAKDGAMVVISDLDTKKLEIAESTIRNQDLRICAIAADVTNEPQIIAAITETYEKYGHIDILVNGAGLQYVSNIEEFPTDKFELLIKVMLTGSFVTTKNVFPIMKKQKF